MQKYFETEMIGGKDSRLQCLLLGMKCIIPARPHTFTDRILDPMHRPMQKARRNKSKVKESNLNKLY